jgi:hypothetical protein
MSCRRTRPYPRDFKLWAGFLEMPREMAANEGEQRSAAQTAAVVVNEYLMTAVFPTDLKGRQRRAMRELL